MENKKIKFNLTKRKVLVWANLIYFLLLCIVSAVTIYLLIQIDDGVLQKYQISITILSNVMSQLTFTAVSLIVYYISIMADALNKKYKEEVKDREDKIN